MSQKCDQELVIQLQSGSLEALGSLYDRHRQLVYRTALAITNDPEAANDLLQDVFLRLYRFAGRVDCARPLEPWLYRMTANLSYTWVKRYHRWFQPLEDLADWFFGGDANPSYNQVEMRDDWNQVQQAVAALPLSQRMVVVLHYLNDLPVQEIADILDMPAGTVKSRLHYGRMALRKKLGMEKELVPDFHFEGT